MKIKLLLILCAFTLFASRAYSFGHDMVHAMLGTIDVTAAKIARVSSTTLDGTYHTGNTIAIVVVFDEPVVVTGTPRILLELGAIDHYATYASGSGTELLTFNYVVQASDSTPKLNYDSTSSLELNGGTIKDKALNVAILTLPPLSSYNSLAYQKNLSIDNSAASPMQVTSFIPSSTGFKVRFNQIIDLKHLNLFSEQAVSLGPSDVVVTNSTAVVQEVMSILLDQDNMGFALQSDITLANDTYTVVIKSGAAALVGANGGLLDGNSDGTAGDDYTNSFTVSNPVGPIVSAVSFSRGPGQIIQTPDLASGPRVYISNASGATSFSFTLDFDESLLDITGLTGNNLPSGAVVVATKSGTGHLDVSVTSATALDAGTYRIGFFTGTVKSDAPLGRTSTIVASSLSQSGAAGTIFSRSSTYLVGFMGDLDGDHVYTTPDGQSIQDILTANITGVNKYRRLSPLVYADVNGSGSLTSLDATRVLQTVTFGNGGKGGSLGLPIIPFKFKGP